MKGQVLDYSVQSNEGVITSEDGKRFTFLGAEWKEQSTPVRGMNVDFDISDDGKAKAIYLALDARRPNISNNSNSYSNTSVQPKSKVLFLLLTFFLGGLGIHKFYMGSWGWGILYILGSFFFYISGFVALIEFIRFLIMNEQVFNEKAEAFQQRNPGPFGFFW